MTGEYDPREDTTSGHLTTAYTYQTVGGKTYLASMTPPAEKTWNFNLNTNGTLDTVTRAQDSAVGGNATWHVIYGIALSGTGLPNMTTSKVARWNQEKAPDDATAVFGPDAPNTTDMTYADITYFTKNGQTTNTASYGAGAWQIEYHEYDQFGNETYSLSPQAIAFGLKAGLNPYALKYAEATHTVYNATGDRVEYVLGPERSVVLENGTGVWARDRTDTVYDDEAAAAGVPVPGRPTTTLGPDDPKPNIPVEVRSYVTNWDGETAGTPATWDTHKTRYRYDKVVSTDGDGWKLQMPTRTSVTLGSGWSTSLTRFDTYGQTIETRTPQGVSTTDGAGSDAKSTITTYFTADTSSPVADCRSHPEWLGLVCQTGPAASTSNDPTTTMTAFDYLQDPTVTTQTSANMTRTIADAYDTDGRVTSESVAMAGAPSGDKPVAATTYTYSPADGSLQSASTSAGSVDRTFDTWGRTLTLTDGAGNTASETYDSAGRVKTANDGKGIYTYTYDGTDSAGRAERRGLVTKLNVGLASGPDEFTAGYDSGGNMTQMTYPNGVVADNDYDITGDETTRTYSRNATAFLNETTYVDVQGRTRIESTTGSYKTYAYDGRGRLTTVQDYTGWTCATRAYTFSLDSDRTSLATSGPAGDGSCSTSSPTTKSSTFDTDDKITNSGYTYDAFGRAQTVPAADTDQTGGGALTADYFANDMVAHLAQNAPTTTSPSAEKSYTLDPLQRIADTTTTTGGVDLHKTTNHYAGTGDSPAWTADQARPDGSSSWTNSWTRNVTSINGGLGIIQSSDGTSRIELTNLHGDIVSTMANTTSTSTALENYSDSTEYGTLEPVFPALGQQYSWLGAKQRSTDTIGGLTLMGARLYNPGTGTFLSQDPVPGGNDNPYTYPPDPINGFDTTGLQTLPGDGRPGVYIVKVGRTKLGLPKRYVGQSNDVTRRLQEHVRNPKSPITARAAARAKIVRMAQDDSSLARRVIEQGKINKYGGIGSSRNTNLANSVAKGTWEEEGISPPGGFGFGGGFGGGALGKFRRAD